MKCHKLNMKMTKTFLKTLNFASQFLVLERAQKTHLIMHTNTHVVLKYRHIFNGNNRIMGVCFDNIKRLNPWRMINGRITSNHLIYMCACGGKKINRGCLCVLPMSFINTKTKFLFFFRYL